MVAAADKQAPQGNKQRDRRSRILLWALIALAVALWAGTIAFRINYIKVHGL